MAYYNNNKIIIIIIIIKNATAAASVWQNEKKKQEKKHRRLGAHIRALQLALVQHFEQSEARRGLAEEKHGDVCSSGLRGSSWRAHGGAAAVKKGPCLTPNWNPKFRTSDYSISYDTVRLSVTVLTE